MLEPVVVEEHGLVLRAFRPEDRPALARAFGDETVAAWTPAPGVDEQSVAEWAAQRNDWSTGDHVSWAVADEAGTLLGSVSLHHLDLDQRDAELGYWLAPWARGRAVGRRAAEMAARFGFRELGLHRVYLYHAAENDASCRLASAAGFMLEGELRQSHRYADGRYHDEHLHARLESD